MQANLIRLLIPLVDNKMVDSLMNVETWTWNADLVWSVFDEDIADLVLQVPISRLGGDDFVSWPHNRLSIYSVRSAYLLARMSMVQTSRSVVGRGMPSDAQAD